MSEPVVNICANCSKVFVNEGTKEDDELKVFCSADCQNEWNTNDESGLEQEVQNSAVNYDDSVQLPEVTPVQEDVQAVYSQKNQAGYEQEQIEAPAGEDMEYPRIEIDKWDMTVKVIHSPKNFVETMMDTLKKEGIIRDTAQYGEIMKY